MTTPTDVHASAATSESRLPRIRPARRLAQVRALATGELRLLGRNKVALMNTLLMPGLLVLFFSNLPAAGDLAFGVVAPIFILGMALIFVVYYTLVTALVARREAYVLQRLRTGEASDATILAGLSTPFALIAAVQTVVCVLGAVLFLGVGMPANLLLIAVAIVLGTLVWTLLGIASTGMTRSVEHAQITTMPLIFVPLLFSGISFPLALLPEWGRTIASLTPLHPVVSLMRLGMAGVDDNGQTLTLMETFTHALSPTLVLLGWTVLGLWFVRRYLRWEPRR